MNAVIWMDTRREPRDPPDHQGHAECVRLRTGEGSHVDQGHRRGAGPRGQGSDRGHPVHQAGTTRRVRGDVQVPRAGRLVEPAAHRALRRELRHDRRPLGDRQPRDRQRSLRRRAAPPGRDRASAPARSRAVRHGRRRDPRRSSPTSWACAERAAWSPRPATSTPPRSVRARSTTSPLTSTSARRRGSPVTCRSRRPICSRNICSLPSAIPGRYLVADEHESAGVCLSFLEENLGLGEGSLEATGALAASVPPGSRGVVFTPWLSGERTPVDDATIRGVVREPVAADPPRGPRPCGVRGCRVQHPVAPRDRRAIRGPAPRPDHADRRGSPVRPLVRDPRRRAGPDDPPGRRPRARQRPGRGPPRRASLSATARVDQIDGAVDIVGTYQPNAVPQPVYDATYAD